MNRTRVADIFGHRLPGSGRLADDGLHLTGQVEDAARPLPAHEQLAADQAWVEFVARDRPGGAWAMRLHARSLFKREDRHWFWLRAGYRPRQCSVRRAGLGLYYCA